MSALILSPRLAFAGCSLGSSNDPAIMAACHFAGSAGQPAIVLGHTDL